MKKIVLFSLEAGVMGGVAGVNRVLCEMFRSMGYEVLPLYLRRGGEECFEGDVIRPDRNWSFTQGKKILSALKRGRLFTALRFSFCRLAEKRRYEEDCRRARALLKRENPDLILTSHYLLPDAIPEELLSRTVHHVHTSFAATAAVRADLETLRRFNGKIRFLWLSEGAKSYNLCIICEKKIVSKKSYAACVSEDITNTAVFFFPISSKLIVFVDVSSAISFESNLPSFD